VTTPQIHPAAMQLLFDFEGKPRLTARLCEGGRYEVAYGVTYYLDGRPVQAGDTYHPRPGHAAHAARAGGRGCAGLARSDAGADVLPGGRPCGVCLQRGRLCCGCVHCGQDGQCRAVRGCGCVLRILDGRHVERAYADGDQRRHCAGAPCVGPGNTALAVAGRRAHQILPPVPRPAAPAPRRGLPVPRLRP
jgi:hypothetical protein